MVVREVLPILLRPYKHVEDRLVSPVVRDPVVVDLVEARVFYVACHVFAAAHERWMGADGAARAVEHFLHVVSHCTVV